MEHKIDEIQVEIDTIDEIPNLESLDEKFIIDTQDWEIENRVTGQVTGFDGHSGEFNVHFSRRSRSFLARQTQFQEIKLAYQEKFINDFASAWSKVMHADIF